MRVKGPHHYKVMALGMSVKWPLAWGFLHVWQINKMVLMQYGGGQWSEVQSVF
jgi:hypothetical protein